MSSRYRPRRTVHRRRGAGLGALIGGLRNTGAISALGGALGQIVPGRAGQVLGGVGSVAGALGFGRRRRPARRSGRGLMSGLRKVNDFLKKTQAISRIAKGIVSTGLVPAPYSGYVSKAGNFAGSLGYGRRRRTVRRRGGCLMRAPGALIRV